MVARIRVFVLASLPFIGGVGILQPQQELLTESEASGPVLRKEAVELRPVTSPKLAAGIPNWQALPQFPSAYPGRSRCGGAWLDDKFYLVGGEETSGAMASLIEVLDPLSGMWSLFASPLTIPVSNISDSVVAFQGRVLVFGGLSSVPAPVGLIQVINPVNGQVQNGGFMPSASFAHATGVDTGRNVVYITAGQRVTPIDKAWQFDGNIFIPLNTSNYQVTSFSSGAYCDKSDRFYVGPGLQNERLFQAFRPSRNDWVQLPSTNVDRASAAVVCFNKWVYLYGGGWATFETSQEIYDTMTNSMTLWTSSGPMQQGRRTFAHGLRENSMLPNRLQILAACGWAGFRLDHAEVNM